MSPPPLPLIPLTPNASPGPCEKEIEKYCDDEEQGDSRLADCLSDSLTFIELTDSDGDGEGGKGGGGGGGEKR